MSTIIHRRNPHIVKLDRRYKGYNRGFRYRVEFNTKGEEWNRWKTVLDWCESAYGKEWEWSNGNGFGHRVWNNNYRTERPARNLWWRQLYLCREEDITMLLLLIGYD